MNTKLTKTEIDIINKVIPFIYSKHKQLLDWGFTKTNLKGYELNSVMIEFKEDLDKIIVHLICKNFNSNVTNVLISNILYREILSKFKEYKFDMNKINYITYQKNIIFNPIIVG